MPEDIVERAEDAILAAYEAGEMDAAGTIEDLIELVSRLRSTLKEREEALEPFAAEIEPCADTSGGWKFGKLLRGYDAHKHAWRLLYGDNPHEARASLNREKDA